MGRNDKRRSKKKKICNKRLNLTGTEAMNQESSPGRVEPEGAMISLPRWRPSFHSALHSVYGLPTSWSRLGAAGTLQPAHWPPAIPSGQSRVVPDRARTPAFCGAAAPNADGCLGSGGLLTGDARILRPHRTGQDRSSRVQPNQDPTFPTETCSFTNCTLSAATRAGHILT